MSKRKPISKKLRFEIFKRDEFICQYCGDHPPKIVLEVDHIISVFDGGDNDQDNLITSCFDCNRGKSKTSLKKIPISLKQKAKEIAEKEAQIIGYSKIIQARKERIESEAWEVIKELGIGINEDDGSISLRKDWFFSIKRFVENLGYHEVLESAEISIKLCDSLNKQRMFLYFCGVCWKKIKADRGN